MSPKRNAAAKPAAKASPAKASPAKDVTSKAKPATKASNGIVSLEPILAAMRKREPKARHAEAEAFINSFYKRMSSDELPQHSAEGWAELATDFLDFARSRKPGAALVRMFNPTIKSEGWESTHTVVQIANDDMPFLVDSVTMALAELGIGVHVLGHPVVTFQRDKAGKLVSVGEGVPESLMHLEIDRQPAEAMPKIRKAVEAVLADVRAAVRDWPQMRDEDAARSPRIWVRASCRSATTASARRRSSCAGPPTTTSRSWVTANTKWPARATLKCSARSRAAAWA